MSIYKEQEWKEIPPKPLTIYRELKYYYENKQKNTLLSTIDSFSTSISPWRKLDLDEQNFPNIQWIATKYSLAKYDPNNTFVFCVSIDSPFTQYWETPGQIVFWSFHIMLHSLECRFESTEPF
ncbi:MAG: hypothetical protein PF447_02020 [Spirochaetaceae bacterium]|jgi:hypothetical protein|nr:hypothetical protein [Spirochaetaceae bacterium]